MIKSPVSTPGKGIPGDSTPFIMNVDVHNPTTRATPGSISGNWSPGPDATKLTVNAKVPFPWVIVNVDVHVTHSKPRAFKPGNGKSGVRIWSPDVQAW